MALKKENMGYYQFYTMYRVIDAAKQEHWMAHSDYLTEGFVTCVSNSEEGLKAEIDKKIARIKLLRLSSRVR